ncbi:hypothetical protein SAMN05444141_102661 [Pseudovibrio denitrificans]|uniref:DNA primase/helicase n=1 Tax=Pseudovibrio denitrificans TaxID=258256 RepID=A0A1I6ZWK1_9HYPH|nr:hypothetical protein [Pseudovibrio denitrificans]SFT67015.1 hypothetical protein SAMN05444141_102661 [Pseudovibrio denitrificans]
MTVQGEQQIRALVGSAARKIATQLDQPQEVIDPLPGEPRGDVKPGEWVPDANGLPPDCPVQVLGMDGDVLFLIDAIGQLAAATPSQFGQSFIQRLFGDRQNYLYWAWPRFDKHAAVDNWRAEKVRECLYSAGAKKGVWNSVEKVRGLGAWTDKEGGLILHLGDVLLMDGKLRRTGEIKGHFYPRRPASPRPHDGDVEGIHNPAPMLYQILQTWNWQRPSIDPYLFLGWIGAGFLGGALPWRPSMFLIGDKAVGKSTLQGIVQTVFGSALVSTPDTTPAGIYQRIGADALPIAVDELEAEADNRKVMGVVKLARLAASGGLMLRGGSDHAGVAFQARSTFLFSAINPPPLPPQDLSRLAVISIGKLDPQKVSQAPTILDPEKIGPKLLRRLVNGWPQFSKLYEEYRTALREGGHDSRGQDTYGTFLTCAHLMLGDDWLEENDYPMENLSDWGQRLAPTLLPEHENAKENWRACLEHLLSSRVDAWRNGLRHNIGGLLEDLQSGVLGFDIARTQLAQVDLGIIQKDKILPGYCLAIPNSGPALSQLFKDTAWGGQGGLGVWQSALRQGPGSIVCHDKNFNKVKIGGFSKRCTLIVLDEFQRLTEES